MASLALGTGATTTFYSLVDHLLLRTLPVPAPHELVLLSNEQDAAAGVSFPVWQQIRARDHLFHSAFAWATASVNMAPAGEVALRGRFWPPVLCSGPLQYGRHSGACSMNGTMDGRADRTASLRSSATPTGNAALAVHRT